MGENSGFICFDGYLERTSKLSDQELGRLMRALMRYHAHGTVPNLKGREEIAFDFIREDIDRTDRRYAAKCEQNRRNRTGKSGDDDGQRPITTVNDRQRPSTTDNEDQRTATKNDDRPQRKSKSKRKNIDLNDDDDDSSERARVDARRDAVILGYQQHAGRQPTPEEQNNLVTTANILGFSPEMLTEAIRIAAGNGATNIAGYARKILLDWTENEVTTPEEADEHKFLFDAATGRNEYGAGDETDIQRMADAKQRRKEKHAEETA